MAAPRRYLIWTYFCRGFHTSVRKSFNWVYCQISYSYPPQSDQSSQQDDVFGVHILQGAYDVSPTIQHERQVSCPPLPATIVDAQRLGIGPVVLDAKFLATRT